MRRILPLILLLAAPLPLTSCTGAGARLHSIVTPRPDARPLAAPTPRRTLEPFAVERPDESADPQIAALLEKNAPPAEDPLLFGLRSAVILAGGKSVGSTSIVLRLPLDGGQYAAFKPDTKKHHQRYRAEIAAFRLSRLLGLDNVPPSVPRAAKMPAILASMASPSARRKLLDQALVLPDGTLPGAMIAWLPGIKPLAIERGYLWTAWGEWLGQTPPAVPIERRLSRRDLPGVLAARPLASQISSMIGFDHLTGNRDRWSGHNVMLDETGTQLVFLDNNLAFDPIIDAPRSKLRALVLARVQKFSRRFITAVRGLSREELLRALGEDAFGAPLLEPAQVDAVLARRTELLATVDALIAEFGAEQVLAFE